MGPFEYLDRRAERRARLAREMVAEGKAVRGFNIRDLIGLVLIGAFISAMGAMFQIAIPRDNKDLLTYMLGQLSGFVAAVVALHYVQKAGEKELDAKRVDNTSKALDAIKAASESIPKVDDPDSIAAEAAAGAAKAADQVADAAVDEAKAIKKDAKP